MKTLVLSSLLFLLVFLAGCTTVSSYVGYTSIDNFYTDYDNYKNKQVKTIGEMSLGETHLLSEQGYQLSIESCLEGSRAYQRGETYITEGVVTCSIECICVSEITYPEGSPASCRNQVIETSSRQTCAVGISEAGCSIGSPSGTQTAKGVVKRYCKDTPTVTNCVISCTKPLEKR